MYPTHMLLRLGRENLSKSRSKETLVSYGFSQRVEIELDKWYNPPQEPRRHPQLSEQDETVETSCHHCIGLFTCSDQGNCKDYIECLRQYMKAELRDEFLRL